MASSTPASATSYDAAEIVADVPAAASSSLWRDAWRRLLRNKLAVAGGITVVILCLVAIFANVLAPQSYTKANFGAIYQFPSREYPLGTDQLGRDVLSRLIYGARVSMLVGLGSQVIVLIIGVPLGAVAGYVGGRTDILMTRFIDVMYAFPRLLFVILVMSMLGAGLVNIFIALGLTGWVGIARQTRAQVLTLKEKEFVEGARALGARGWRVRSEEHTSELQSLRHLVCRLLLEKKKKIGNTRQLSGGEQSEDYRCGLELEQDTREGRRRPKMRNTPADRHGAAHGARHRHANSSR